MTKSYASSASVDTSDPTAGSRQLIVVSNRLPISLRIDGDGIETFPSAGGLATAVKGLELESGCSWVGWPGCTVREHQRPEVERLLAASNLTPVYLTAEQEDHYYRGTCNQVLWPLFHYFTDHVTFEGESWDHYECVNEMFAERITECAAPAARVWIHDFHLMLVPELLRARRSDLEIGFFLHIPFPSSEIYRLLPKRSKLLRGVLGADYVGFHTNDYARHFRSACLRVLGLDSEPDYINYQGRRVGIGTNPIGIDVAGFREVLHAPATTTLYRELCSRYEGRKLILGIERLDYTKGVLKKLQAFERFLERDPERAKYVTMLQVLVPSRLDHPEYQDLKREIEELVGRINGQHGSPANTPVEYMHRSIASEQLVALYHRADAMLVTPVRDGMNLVAQEFVLCQGESPMGDDHRGMLVLSEFAGAAHYLSRSMLVNPWNVERTADALERAIWMPSLEKQERMAAMVERVVEMDCRNWASDYLDKLDRYARSNRSMARDKAIRPDELAELAADFARAPKRLLLLDYDGTLRELTRHPEEAEPTAEIRTLLEQLARLPNTEVHVVSGRSRDTMDVWFGQLPIHLCAEHGFIARKPGEGWAPLHQVDLSWMDAVASTLRQVASEVPGALVEHKSCALAWHYRMADLDYGVWRARELLSWLEENLANEPVEVIPGHRVIEVRAGGVNKGSYVLQVVTDSGADDFVFCAGDDRTDDDMFRVLPANATSVFVGAGTVSDTDYSVESPEKMRALLEHLLRAAKNGASAGQPA